MAAPVIAAHFDDADPAAFYLLAEGRADMERMADVTLVAAGKRLPAHRVVLSLQSGVLRGLFADCDTDPQLEMGFGKEGPVLEAPFKGTSLFDAALFLRFCYQPRNPPPANLSAVLGSLPGLLRLAHKLDAQQIQQAVGECMAEKVRSATLSELLDWVEAAHHCQLPELVLHCISEVARRLASCNRYGVHHGLADTFAAAVVVAERCDKNVLAQLLALTADASAAAGAKIAAPAAAATALQQAPNHGSFEWALEPFSQQPSGMGEHVWSPWLSAAGKEWRLGVYPGGDTEEAAGHLSAYLYCKTRGVRARFAFAVACQADQAAGGSARDFQHDEYSPKLFEGRGWGNRKFVAIERLRSRPGYLVGDRLLLRVRIEVEP